MSDTHKWFFKVTFSVKLLVLDEYFTKLHKIFSAESQDHREHIQNSENFAQGDGTKLRLDLWKFFFRYGMKVGGFYKKSTEWNFEKISQNTYLDPISLTKNFQEFLIHKSCEKSKIVKKQSKNTTFSHFPTFLEIYELKFFHISFI